MSERRYGRWAGNPGGFQERPEGCIKEVPDGGRSPLFHQCSRKRGHGPDGLWCKQHGRKEAERLARLESARDDT